MRSLFLFCVLSISFQAQAAVIEMRDYFESLGPSYPVQSSTNQWTFQRGDHSGSYLQSIGYTYYDGPSVQQIGAFVNAGSGGCTPGYCGSNPAATLATFNGVFVHPGPAAATAAVFHADTVMAITEIKLWSETIGNAESGNGFNVIVNAVLGGVTQNIGSFNFDYPSTLTNKIETLFLPAGLTLAMGDEIEILYGNRGSYLYDHGNVNAFITTAAPGASAIRTVPEPASLALMLAGSCAAAGMRRRKQRQADTVDAI